MIRIAKNLQEIEKKETLVVGLFEGQTSIDLFPNFTKRLSALIEKKLVSTELGELTYVTEEFDFNKVYFLGLGKQEEYSLEKCTQALRGITVDLGKNITILLHTLLGELDIQDVSAQVVTTVSFYDYKFDLGKTKKSDRLESVTLITEAFIEGAVQNSLHLAEAVLHTRELVNKPYNYLNAKDLANYAKDLAKELKEAGVTCQIFDKKEIEKMEMNAFLGVNQGSTDEPYLIYLRYQGKEEWDNPITLVGKGVMYDTGGYSLKPSMNSMKCDMGGAATVLGAFEVAVKNGLYVNLSVVIAATDNRVSGHAYLPDDILTAMNKKTIEIVSTDAEGRLTLADALTFAQREGSKEVIDVATLTGAIGVALGEYTTGLFGNDINMIEEFKKSAKVHNEGIWHMPITEEIKKEVRGSKVADLTNSTGRLMGASGAAAFLEEFIEEDTKWIHLDIAFTAFRRTPVYKEHPGGSGAMVASIYEYLKTRQMI